MIRWVAVVHLRQAADTGSSHFRLEGLKELVDRRFNHTRLDFRQSVDIGGVEPRPNRAVEGCVLTLLLGATVVRYVARIVG